MELDLGAVRAFLAVVELAGSTPWMPDNAPEGEQADYYRYLSTEFDVRIDTSGPVFGHDHIMEKVGASADPITLGNTT